MFIFAVLGQIRTTVCQAQLLMRKKLKQYISLVEEAQDPTVEKRANADDLQVSLNTTIFANTSITVALIVIVLLSSSVLLGHGVLSSRRCTKEV